MRTFLAAPPVSAFAMVMGLSGLSLTWSKFSHVSQFQLAQDISLIFGLLGAILAIVMWATNKEKSPFVDSHGKNILNWFISSMIYIVASIILAFFCIGYLILFGVAITHLIFIIILFNL